MYSIILGTAGYSLLTFNIIFFIVMLKRSIQRKTFSPFHILSISDTLCSAFMGIILLANHIAALTNFNDDGFNNLTNIWDLQKLNEQGLQSTLLHYSKVYNQANQTITNKTFCNSANILMHYGMFLMPLTNTFVSLLAYFVQCNASVSCMKYQCMKFLQTQLDVQAENLNINSSTLNITHRKSKNKMSKQEAAEEEVKKSSTGSKTNMLASLSKLFSSSTFDEKMKNKRVTRLCVISQWVIPLAVTSLLYFPEYHDMNTIINSRNVDCIFETEFLFNGHCIFEKSTYLSDTPNFTDSKEYQTNNDYISNEHLRNASNVHNANVNAIVSEVYELVHSMLHNTVNASDTSTISTRLYNHSDLQLLTKYMDKANNVNSLKYNNNRTMDISTYIKKILMENTNADNLFEIVTQNNNDIMHIRNPPQNNETILGNPLEAVTKINSSLQGNLTEGENIYVKVTTEVFDATDVANSETITVHIGNVGNDMTDNVETTANNKQSISKEQIYADIVKRISGTIFKPQISSRTYRHKQPEQNNFLQKHYRNISVSEITTFRYDMEGLNANLTNELKYSMCMVDKCFISTNFLRLYLLLLLFIIYFLPLILSFILQVRGRLVCKNILERLQTQDTITLMLDTSNDGKALEQFDIIDGKKSGQSHYNFKHKDKELTTDCILTDEEFEHQSTSQDCHEDKWHTSGIKDIPGKTYKCKRMQKKAMDTLKVFNSIRMSLLCGILFWTPMFLQILLKAFLCIHISEWVIGCSFLSAIFFGILRNFFNFTVMKIQENGMHNVKKDNSIVPIV